MEQTIALIERSHQGDKEARDKLVEDNLGLVWNIVKRYTGRGYDAEDLFQIGSIGLIKAIDKFNTDYEVKLSTYAVPMISGEIKRFLRDDGMVKISRSIKENSWKVRKAREKLAQKLGREATIEEISVECKLTKDEIIMAADADMEIESIYKGNVSADGSEYYLADKLADKEDAHEELVNHLLIEKLISDLNDQEKELIKLRYYESKTQTQVAKVLHISQVQVSRMEMKVLCKMRMNA